VLALVLLVYFVWSPSCASRKTCADLKADSGGGWPTVAAGGTASGGLQDASVCGESDDGLGPGGSKQCYGGTNSNANDMALGAVASHGWEHANEVCGDAGARLCTVAELLNEVTRGTGCQHDAEMTWSSESCSLAGTDGHVTVQGGQHRGDEACPDECGIGSLSGGNTQGSDCALCKCTPRCAPDGNTHAIRCCADVNHAVALEKCSAYIGYRGILKAPPPVSNMQGDTATDSTDADNRRLSAMCRSTSSCSELQKKYGGWPVGAMHENIRAGNVLNGQQPMSGAYGQSGAMSTMERHDSGVCGESDNGLGNINDRGERENQCWGGINDGTMAGVVTDVGSHTGRAGSGGSDPRISGWSHALQICEGVGARLCTVEELVAENTRATGCGHDCEMCWTSQTSSQCKPNQHIVAQGGLNCGYQVRVT